MAKKSECPDKPESMKEGCSGSCWVTAATSICMINSFCTSSAWCYRFIVFVLVWSIFQIWISVGFKQKSSAVAEEEALPGSASGQDGEPDRQPGAHGEEWRSWWSCCVWSQTNSSSLFCFSQVQDLEFAQIERRVIEGLKVGNDCLKKMHEVGDGTFTSGASQALYHSYRWVDRFSRVRWCQLKKWNELWMKLKMPSNTKG